MARISSKRVGLEPSPSPDVVGYKMYYQPSDQNAAVTYESSFVYLEGNGPWDLEAFAELAALDGDFDIAFSSVDDGGNESDLTQTYTAVPLDFTAPSPPGQATFGS